MRFTLAGAGGGRLLAVCLEERSGGKALAPQVKRQTIEQMIAQHHLSERRACSLVGLSPDSYRHSPEADQATKDLSDKIV